MSCCEGKFDFTLIDRTIDVARSQDLLFCKGDEKFYITDDGEVVAPDHRDDPDYDDSFFLNCDVRD